MKSITNAEKKVYSSININNLRISRLKNLD